MNDEQLDDLLAQSYQAVNSVTRSIALEMLRLEACHNCRAWDKLRQRPKLRRAYMRQMGLGD